MATIGPKILLVLCVLPWRSDVTPPTCGKLASAAAMEMARGDYEHSRQTALRGFERWRNRPDSSWHWEFRLSLAESSLELNRIDEARALLDNATPAEPFRGRWLVDTALLHYRVRDFTRAADLLDQAGPLLSDGSEMAARRYLIRGMLHLKQEQYRDAESSFREAVADLQGSGSLMEFYSLVNLGHLYLLEFRYDEALHLFERVRAIAAATHNSRAEAMAAGNIGVARLWLGDTDGALALLNEAARISRSANDPVYELRWLAMIGEAYQSVKDYARAAEYYDRARSLARPKSDDDRLSQILFDRSGVALELGDMPTARRLSGEMHAIAKRLNTVGDQVLSSLAAARVAAAEDRHLEAERLFKKAVALSKAAGDRTGEWRCRAGLASLFRETGRWRDADREYRAAIGVIEQERSKIGEDGLRLTFLSSLIRFYQEYVDFLMDRGQTEQAFQVAVSSRARVMAEKLQTSSSREGRLELASLQRLVSPSGSVLASYWLAPKRSFLWVIDGSQFRSFVLPPESEIRSRISRWRKAILDGERPEEKEPEAGEWLITKLVSDHFDVPQDHTLYIVPDASLFELNFETLPSPSGSGYWIDDVNIAVAPALSLLHPFEPSGEKRLLLIGNPDFKSAQFPRLAHLKNEMRDVSAYFPEKDVYGGAAATPEAYRQAATASYSTLHFAAHAIASRESPLDSAILLSGKPGDEKLYARDILKHPLRADLVTLSACQTAGQKTYAGEGLTGLAWAFLSAGARHVVAGLWDVDDRATSQLMSGFYESLRQTHSPSAALREAKLGLMRSSHVYEKPIYWAAFETFTNAVQPPGASAVAQLKRARISPHY